MNISEVRIKLIGNSDDRLRAFCSITLDGDFVVRDLKIIEGVTGPFIAMPSRKLSDHCTKCGSKNHLRARFCNDCGTKLREARAPKDRNGRTKLHADIAHPINSSFRARLQEKVVEAYEEELVRSKQPGYVPQDYDDEDLNDYDETFEHEPGDRPDAERREPAEPAPAASEPRRREGEDASDDDQAFGQGIL